MKELYSRLIQLQRETTGATFVMGYSIKRSKYFICFNNKAKRLEADEPERVIQHAIDWILETRREHPLQVVQNFTLFSYYKD